MNASDYQKRAKWLRAVATRMGSRKAADILRECANDMIAHARRIEEKNTSLH